MVKTKDFRFEALWRFALAITLLTILGHTVFGFEQSWAQPLIALATAYSVEILLELVDAVANRRTVRFAGGVHSFVSFLLPAHITALAVVMLLYTNDQWLPIAFATAAAIGSKAIFRAPIKDNIRHFLNPSNFGITITLLLFPWVSIAPPYHFTENLTGPGDWILPGLLMISGAFLNVRFTKKLPLILSWLGAFALQAILRGVIFGTPLVAGLIPITGVAFLLFTFYMVTDPGTTPLKPRAQIVFGISVAAVYGFLMMVHVVFGLFFALTIVCALRGLGLFAQALVARGVHAKAHVSTHTLQEGSQP